MRGMIARGSAIVAVVLVGLMAGTALAHVLEMPHKLAMDYSTWFPIQSLIYDGWGRWLGLMLGLATLALVLLAAVEPAARSRAIAALVFLAVSEGFVFLVWIAPTNAAVEGFAGPGMLPDWQSLRANWEWGHLTRFILLALAAFCAPLALARTSTADSRRQN